MAVFFPSKCKQILKEPDHFGLIEEVETRGQQIEVDAIMKSVLQGQF